MQPIVGYNLWSQMSYDDNDMYTCTQFLRQCLQVENYVVNINMTKEFMKGCVVGRALNRLGFPYYGYDD